MKKFISTSLAFLAIITPTSFCPNTVSAVGSKSNIKFCLKSVSNILWTILPAILARAIFKSNDSPHVRPVDHDDTFPLDHIQERKKVEILQLPAHKKLDIEEERNDKLNNNVVEEEKKSAPVQESKIQQHLVRKEPTVEEKRKNTLTNTTSIERERDEEPIPQKEEIDIQKSRHAQFINEISKSYYKLKTFKPNEVNIIELSDENFISDKYEPLTNVDGKDPVLITDSENYFKDKPNIRKMKLLPASYHDSSSIKICIENNESIIERYNKSNFIEYDNANALIKFFIEDKCKVTSHNADRYMSDFLELEKDYDYYLISKAMEKKYLTCASFHHQDILSQIKYVKSDILKMFIPEKSLTPDERKNIFRHNLARTIYRYDGKFYRILGFLGSTFTNQRKYYMDNEECEKVKIQPNRTSTSQYNPTGYYKMYVKFTVNDGDERLNLIPRSFRFYYQPYFASSEFVGTCFDKGYHAVISLIPCDIMDELIRKEIHE